MEQRAPTSSIAANMAAGLSMNSIPNSKNDEEWKNINTMLNCILSMVEKTKRALAILQQRGKMIAFFTVLKVGRIINFLIHGNSIVQPSETCSSLQV